METNKAYITLKGFISVKGEDSIDFIQNIISNDIKKVTDVSKIVDYENRTFKWLR